MSGPSKLSDEEYDELLKPLAQELSAMARWVSETDQRMIVVFEGRDTAGEGEIVLFDRSWYNRAGVERVMGFCTPDQAQDFLNAAPEFERHLVDDGIFLFKYWLCCDQE